MTNEYKNYLLTEIAKAEKAWREAFAREDYDEAFIQGKRLSDLEAIYYYHNR